jgi:hypothetical protein
MAGRLVFRRKGLKEDRLSVVLEIIIFFIEIC